VINAVMLKMAAAVIPGFDVIGFWPAVFGSLLISLISWLLNSFVNERGMVTTINVRKKRSNHTIDLEHKGDDHWE
jgi:putative membrane protein